MKKTILSTLGFTILLSSLQAFAVSDSCRLEQIPIPASIQMTAADLSQYRERLRSECLWKQNNDQFQQALRQQYQLRSEQITEYQALRFVKRIDFENSKKFQTPVELTYQIHKEQYLLPNEQKSSVIWDNWTLGMQNLAVEKQALLSGQLFDLAKLKKIHVGFFQLDPETGDAANIPYPGVLKAQQMQDNYWWELKNEEVQGAQQSALIQNQLFYSLGFMTQFKETYLNKLLDVRQVVKRQTDPAKVNVIEYVYAIYGGQTRANPINLQNILGFMNSMLSQGIQNQHMVWRGKLMTPVEIAYLTQKFYVILHPFFEGNGRTSRFLQELILTSLDMPYGSSGDLMESDVLSLFDDYYAQAMNANNQLMQTMNSCLNEYDSLKDKNPALAQQGLLNYNCRILKSKN